MKDTIIAKDGYIYIVILGIITLLCAWWNLYVAIVPFVLLCFVLYFFRNPKRRIRRNDRFALSPGDGKVMSIEKIKKPELFGNEEVYCINIFLSIFNVHFQRMPIKGEIAKIHHIKGQFLPAFKSHASDLNERNYIVIENEETKAGVSQITGFIARRIVCRVEKNDQLRQGDIFGLIKFGSCVELFLPLDYEILVKPSDSVRGGKTIMAKR